MSDLPPSPDGANPFSTRRIRPGALPYLFRAGQDAADLVARLAENGWRGQIVGPHGSGKSTLLATLRTAIERQGRRVVSVTLHDRQRRLPPESREAFHAPVPAEPPPATVLVVDGYEQLPWWRRRWIQHRCRRCGVGLLVTSHRPLGLPAVFRTRVDLELARRVVARLLTDSPDAITDQDVADALERHGQDFREALFDLYDLVEQRRQEEDASRGTR